MKNAAKKYLIIVFLYFGVLISFNTSYAQTTDTYTSSGTWICPAGVTSVTVECWGAGGKGGNGANRYGAGGGGGGAYSYRSNISVSPGNSYSVQVGIGGDVVLANRASFFIDINTVIANGGNDGSDATGGSIGNGGTGGLWSTGDGDFGYSGGDGGNGNSLTPASGGGGGSSAGTSANGNPGITITGGTAPTGGGDGGNGGTNTNGSPGLEPGGGGGAGGDKNTNGANGANGKVTITYTASVTPTITLGGNPAICQGITSADLTYSATTNSPDQYSIDYDAAAEAEGFSDITLASLPASPIVLVIPANAAAATYNANLTVTNSGTSETSSNYPITISVKTTPSDVTVSGGGSHCDNVTLIASGGTGGTIYWQNTTSGGTSITTPSTSETVSASGTYYFRAENNGCWSNEGSASVTINSIPSTGAISGPTNVLASTSGLIYSITAIPSATNYTWAIPTGWSYESGQGTNSITITSGTSGQDGDISVYASNTCGDDPTPSTLAVTIGSPPDCPSSTSVAPSATQTVCEDAITNQLTATINTSGGSGTPTLLYQWYYNTTNSNTVAGANKISGATSSTYTPLSTSAETGDRWYFCVGYATDNTCGQTDTDESLASTAVQVTVNPKPGTPSAISGSANVSPGETNLIYSSTSVNATSYAWTIPAAWPESGAIPGQGSASITVTAGADGDNGDITIKGVNACGESTIISKAITVSTVDAPPTITLGPDPTSCENTDADLTYSATTDNPDQYNISFGPAATLQGFTDVIAAALPVSPIKIAVPNNVDAGTYSATLSVTNTTSGLSSVNYSFSINVNGKPGSISGINSVNQNTQGYEYNIDPVANALSYTWSFPTANWIVTVGDNTNSITVTSGDAGSGNISVEANYACGTSTPSTFSVTVSDVTDHTGINCSDCHTFHGAAGPALTKASGASALCLSCHNAGSIAKDLPFLATDQANSTGNRNSHSWDATSINAKYGAVLPTIYSEMTNRVVDGNISCSTCHDQHNGNAETNYLRINNTNDVICKDCHMPRDVGTYAADNVNHRGSHPIDVTLDTTGDRFGNSPTLAAHNDVIICSTCHGVHDVNNTGTLTTDGNLLKFAVNDETLCTDCHTPMSHNGMTCITCHDVHNPDKTNIYMINDTITTPNSGDKEVIFTAETGTNSFADGDATYDGICEVCHTTVSHYRNDGSGPDQSHTSQGGQDGNDCTGCHPHSNSFSAAGGTCTACHTTARGSEYGRGGVVQIVGDGGEFASSQVSRHTAADPTDEDCESCHYSSGSHPNDAMVLRDVDAVDTENTADLDVYCIKCHDGDAPTNIVDYSYINTATYNKSVYAGNAHDLSATNSCAQCHNRHGSANASLLTQATNYAVCRTCHDGTGVAPKSSIDINVADIATPGVSGTSHAWDVSASSGLYETNAPTGTEPGPTMTARLISGNIVCSTCHDPHDNTNSKFLVSNNLTDQMCKDCHSARDVLRYSDTPSGTGSHPVGIAYSGTGSVKASPTGSVVTIGGNVECSSCHMTHNATTTDGNLLRQTNDNALCMDCHTYGTHNGFSCKDCHDTHNTDKTNIYMVGSTVNGNTVSFPDLSSFADESAPYDGICEVCHVDDGTPLKYHRADGSGSSHNPGTDCTSCHPHNKDFAAPQCDRCHELALGINWESSGTNAGHAAHSVKYNFDCNTCHFGYGFNEADHPSSTLNADSTMNTKVAANFAFDPTGLAYPFGTDAGLTPTYNGDKTCDNVYCHSNGRNAYRGTNGTDTWSNTTGSQSSNYPATTPAWDTGTINTCNSCHPGEGNMVSPYYVDDQNDGSPNPFPTGGIEATQPATGSHGPNRGAHSSNSQEYKPNTTDWDHVQCFWCHNSNGADPVTGQNLQGTYGTSYHVDGKTRFNPRSYETGGTILPGIAPDPFSYSYDGSAGHCGNGKTCW